MMQSLSSVHQESHIPPGHSGRIKYATPQELPSFPSSGLKEDGAAAGAAASLGWANQKPVELWKPTATSSASVAAHLANDHQRHIEPWKPSSSSSAASAALLANDNHRDIEAWKPTSSSSAASAALLANDYKMPQIRETERSSAPYQAANLAAASAASALKHPRQNATTPRSTWGNSAANQAFHAANSPSPRSPPAEESYALSRNESLRGARGAVAGSRPRAISTPQKYTYPDQANALANAQNAAAVSHRASVRGKYDEAGSVPYTNMAREMFTSHPPVKLEVEEKQHADSLHASAVAMAKRMYTQQQKAIDSAKNHDASTAAARSSSISRRGAASPTSSNEPSAGFPNLQEAAYRLAQERLAKLEEDHQKERGYQDYYNAPNPQRNAGRLGSIRGKLTRRRSSSDGDLVDDRQRSQQIRQEMSMFNSTLSKVDEEKRTSARQALLAAAQRNVKAQMEGMDQKMYEDTGRVPPSRLNDWEMKAHSAALMKVDSGRDVNEGKIDLGAGVFMTQEEVNTIAAKRIQPVLDDINRKAEAERERQLAAKLDEEHRQEGIDRERNREKEVQDIHKKIKDQQKDEEKRIKAEAKAMEKARKEQEKAAKAEEKRRAKEEKRKSKDVAKPVAADLQESVAEEDRHDEGEPSTQTAELIAPVLPVAAPVLPSTAEPAESATPAAAPVAAEASPAEVEESKAKAEEEKTDKPEERRKSKFLKKPLALDLRKRHSIKGDTQEQPPATAPLERREQVDTSTTHPAAIPKERSQSFSGGRRGSNSPPLDDESRSGTSKLKSWFSSHFSRPRTKSIASAPGVGAEESASPAPETSNTAAGPGFIGGAALRQRTESSASASSSAASSASSLRDVAFASVARKEEEPSTTYPAAAAEDQTRERSPSPARSVSSVSSYSTDDGDDEGEEGRDRFEEAREEMARSITPPPPAGGGAGIARSSASPQRESRFSEVLD